MNNNDNIIELIDNGMLNYLQKDKEFAKDYLSDNGFDMNNERELANRELRKRFALAKAYEKQISDGALLNQAMRQLREVSIPREGLDTVALQSLLQESGVGLQFRNLEDWSDDEIREALGDVDLIRLLEKLKNLGS